MHAIWHLFCARNVAALVIWIEKLPFVIFVQILVFCLAELYTLCNFFSSAVRARLITNSIKIHLSLSETVSMNMGIGGTFSTLGN